MSKIYKIVTEQLTTLDTDIFEGSVNDLIKILERLHKDFPGFDDFIIKDDSDLYCPDASAPIYVLFGTRKETNTERDKRLSKSKKARVSQKKRREKESKEKEERELKTYARLKAKFEKGK